MNTSCFRFVSYAHISTGQHTLLFSFVDLVDCHPGHLMDFFVIDGTVIIVHATVSTSHQTAWTIIETTLAVGAMHHTIGIDRTIHAERKKLSPWEGVEFRVTGMMRCSIECIVNKNGTNVSWV